MTKTEHLQFLVLMIPTFLILAAAAVSMADLASRRRSRATGGRRRPDVPVHLVWDDRPARIATTYP